MWNDEISSIYKWRKEVLFSQEVCYRVENQLARDNEEWRWLRSRSSNILAKCESIAAALLWRKRIVGKNPDPYHKEYGSANELTHRTRWFWLWLLRVVEHRKQLSLDAWQELLPFNGWKSAGLLAQSPEVG